jgi:hypothetical protein
LEGKTALEMLNNIQIRNPIITFSSSLDDLLGGGIPLGKVTEFCKCGDIKFYLSEFQVEFLELVKHS